MKKNYIKKLLLTLTILITYSTIIFAQTENCPTGMIHYWSFDETSGTGPYADLFGLDADCSAEVGTDCPVVISNVNQIGASAANFYQGNSYGIDIPDDNSLDWSANDSFTIEFWLLSNTTLTENQVVVARDARTMSSGNIHMWVGIEGDPSNGTSNDGTVRFQLRDVNDDPASPYLGGKGPKVNDNQWHHIVAVRDESLNENRLYVDGAEIDKATFDYTGGFSSNAIMTVGYLFRADDPGRFFLNGKVDELALYNTALPVSDIIAHYNSRVSYCSKAPEITSVPVTTVIAEQAYSYDVEVKANPAATFTLENSPPAGMTIDGTSGLIEWTPTTSDLGNHNIRVKASNSLGFDVQDFTINVSLENVAPTFTKGDDITITVNSGSQLFEGWATNIDDNDSESEQVLTFNVSSDKPGDFKIEPAINSDGDLSFEVKPDVLGDIEVTVTLSDDGGGDNESDPQTFTITIEEITGINKEDISSSMKIFPNPSDNSNIKLRIENNVLGGMSVKIIDLSGKLCFSEKVIKNTSLVEYTFDINKLSKGIYFLKLINKDYVGEAKIIKN